MKILYLFGTTLLTACFQPVTDVPSSSAANNTVWTLRLKPDTALDESAPVVSLHLVAEGDESVTAPENIALVEGTPSSVSLGKYEDGETTEALAERLVPIEVFAQSNHIEIRPRGVLALGQTYTLISNLGVLGVVVVARESERGYLARRWPPLDTAFGVVQAIYCGENTPVNVNTVELFPPGHWARLEPGLDETGELSENCVRLVPSASSSDVLLPPETVEGVSFEPTPFQTSPEFAELSPAECQGAEVTFGPGCASVDGDRAVIRGPAGITFWALSSIEGRHFQILDADSRLVVPNLRQLTDGVLNAIVFDLAGRSQRVQAHLTLPLPAPRLVINEVMSNPLGTEPSEEWVELMNAGDTDAIIQGYTLADGGGQVKLPNMVLEPGAFVVLARDDFTGGTAGDVAPFDGTVIVRLSELAKNGLANSGEPVKLIDAKGTVVSSFPSRASERAGTSIARRDPSVLDDDPTGFLSHAAPGASPGRPNQVE
jgi:hypothetical protein